LTHLSLTSRTLVAITSWFLASYAYGADAILPQSLVVSLQIEEVFEYRCPGAMQCQLRCDSEVGEQISYQNVKRAEVARSETHWVFGAVYIDSLGKGHKTSGFLPEPASCIFDDLEFIARIPVIDGDFSREPEEVIFELSPSN
jgi:hypothetical protein